MAANGCNFYGGSIDKVLESVMNFRAENALPLGDIEHEMAAQYAAIAPWLVYDTPDHEPSETQRVAEWVMGYWRRQDPHHGIFTDIPKKRMEVCRECPLMSHAVTPDGTNRYEKTAGSRAAVISGDLAWHVHGTCRHHFWPLLIANRLKEPKNLAVEGSPAHCWVNRTEL